MISFFAGFSVQVQDGEPLLVYRSGTFNDGSHNWLNKPFYNDKYDKDAGPVEREFVEKFYKSWAGINNS